MAAAPETKRRKVGGLKGEGTLAAAEAMWLERLDISQDDTNKLLGELLMMMKVLVGWSRG